MSAVREQNMELLRELGFRPAGWLPQERFEQPQLRRPLDEIASRLMALDAVFSWVNFTEEEVASGRITDYIGRNRLKSSMTEEEREIIAFDREAAQDTFVDTIGWKLENMWPLAWVLGFDEEPGLLAIIESESIRRILIEFLPGLEATLQDLLGKCIPQPQPEVDRLEDLFYCAHNAVRSAQLGGATVPNDFEPMSTGGAVHERRHALTWCLSPGVGWDDTDLST